MVKKTLNLSIPYIKKNELNHIVNCVKSGWVSSAGPLIEKFEKKITSFTKSKYAIACINGTSALHISLLLAGVTKNHEVIVPTVTFIAPINAVKYCNAEPVFMDCDYDFNININKTIDFINNCTFQKKGKCFNKKTNKHISTIIIVHVWGNPVRLKELLIICKLKNIKLIEDASESLGSSFEGYNKHTGTIGFCGCISFNGNKIITTGGGGVILTQNKNIALKAKYLVEQAKNKSIWFEHDDIGYNYRMNNLQAALGIAQIENLKVILKKRKNINKAYKKHLKNNFKYSFFTHSNKSNYWMNLIKIKEENKIKLNQLINKFRKELIEVRPIWKPNHMQKQFLKNQNYKIKIALILYKKSLCIPSSTELTIKDLIRVFNVLN